MLAGHRIEALSVGGVETCHQLPGFNLAMDIGRCPPGVERLGTLLLTHGHIDHAAGLPYYVSLRGMMHLAPPRVFVPEESREILGDILRSWARLQSDALRCELVGVQPGDVLPLSKHRFARAFRSPHRIACVGYTLFQEGRQRRPELAHLSEAELEALARRGEQVHEQVTRPEICFPGDTSAEVIDLEETVTTARVLLLECTFLGEHVARDKARRGGHVHLEDLAERAHLFRNEAILLTHFSRRHSRAEIEAAVRARLPESLLPRVHLLLPR
jgi:ribonuclease Z